MYILVFVQYELRSAFLVLVALLRNTGSSLSVALFGMGYFLHIHKLYYFILVQVSLCLTVCVVCVHVPDVNWRRIQVYSNCLRYTLHKK